MVTMTADDIRTRLDAIEAYCAAATEGPWWRREGYAEIDGQNYAEVLIPGPVTCGSYCYGGSSTIDGDRLDADLAFIAAARTDLPAVVAALRDALAEVERLTREMDTDDGHRYDGEGDGPMAWRRYVSPEDRLPAPSSPDRIEAVAQALAAHEVEQRRSDLTAVCVCGFDFDPLHFGEPWHTHLGEAAVAALDAYDREHPKPDLRGKVVGAAQIEAALRERIAADIEADVLLSPFSGGREVNAYNHGARNAASHAARIVRSGVPRTEEARTGPHSRACGIKRHDHGTECHSNCPTCRGSEVPR